LRAIEGEERTGKEGAAPVIFTAGMGDLSGSLAERQEGVEAVSMNAQTSVV
jgi:hypothetical protein